MALGYTGYLKSLDYARTRTQGRPPGAKDPAAPPVPLVEHADVRRMLLAQKAYVEGGLALVLYCAKLLDEQRTAPTTQAPGARAPAAGRAHADREELAVAVVPARPTTSRSRSTAATATPASTTSSSTTGTTGSTRSTRAPTASRRSTCSAARSSMHGGAGLAAAGGRRSARRSTRRWTPAARPPSWAPQLKPRSTGSWTTTTRPLWPTVDPAVALANASVYLEAAGHVVVAWIWLEQFLATGERDGAFYEGKRQAARYFFRFELPQTGPQFDLLARLDRTTLDVDPSVL